MMTTNDVANVILASPGMGESVKIDLKTTRRNVMLLSGVIMKGLGKKDEGSATLVVEDLPKELVEELVVLTTDILQKAGLSELNAAMKALGKK